MKKLAVILASLLVTACASSPKTDSSQPAQTKESNAAASAPVTTAASEAEVAANTLKAELKTLQQQSIYFDFDRYAVKPEYRNTIVKQAEFLKTHKDDIVTLEGNADERGSAEFNLALGSKRAMAVESNLKLLGVPASQMKVVSLAMKKSAGRKIAGSILFTA
jgi:peptidoglycan-associated lipoprotein